MINSKWLKYSLFTAVAFIMAALPFTLVGCAPGGGSEGELVVYNARSETFVKPLLEQFESEMGIRVRVLSGREELVNQIEEERNNVRADIFISNDAGAMEYLRRQDLLAPNDAPALGKIDQRFRAADGSWVGLSARARVLIYNKNLISEEEMPESLRELADPEWAGRFMITRGGNISMVTHVAALRKAWGDEETRTWLSGLSENAGAITGGHTDIRRAVGAGEYLIGLVNNYYYHLQLEEDRDNNVGAVYPDQGEGEIGTFVNVAGVALINDGPNKETARAFIDWILEDEQQHEFSYHSKETPLNPDIPAPEGAKPIDRYRAMDINLANLGPHWPDAKELIQESGLDLGI